MAQFFKKPNSYRSIPTRPIKEYSKESIGKMAVLFTDIVGSSRFFKKRGDIAGRKMLKLHQDMSSPLINKFGGTLLKMLGDSVMAYFPDPGEALKSAIKIQRKFHTYNKENDAGDQIHIRVCIHFGEGIIEENDIFGDVVNMAAKFLPGVDSDQIVISREVLEHIHNLPLVEFESIEIPDKKKVLSGLSLFRVKWDRNSDFEPVMKTLLYIKPVYSLGGKVFTGIWQSMLDNKRQLWPDDKVDREITLSDNSIALIVKELPFSLKIAGSVIKFLRTGMWHKGDLFAPVQIIIDSGPYLMAGRLSLEGLKVNWRKIEPGEIYISDSAHKALNTENNFSIDISTDTGKPRSFFKVRRTDQEKKERNLFLYQNALIQGDNPTCFYCGAMKHPTADCPSKQMTEITNSLGKLGYLPIDEINNLFFNYLNEANSDGNKGLFPGGETSKESPIQGAHNAFFELKTVYQLRFLRTIWNLQEDDWNRIKEKKHDQDKGGLLWIGLDCIRVSNFKRAESIIKGAMSNKNKDYKLFCLAGFLDIERNNLPRARNYLNEALELTKKTPQKIFVLFLLSRIHSLSNNHTGARALLRKIIRLSPYCSEALYTDILHKFHHGDKWAALDQLIKLIRMNRDYYLISLIDPELFAFSNIIHPRLKRLFIEAKEKAAGVIPGVKDELGSLIKLIGKDSKGVAEARSMASKIEEYSKTESYFGYLDIIHYADSINNMGDRIIKYRKIRLSKTMHDLGQRLGNCHSHVKSIPYPFLTTPVSKHMAHLQKKIDTVYNKIKSGASGGFDNSLKMLDLCQRELGGIELKLKHLDSMGQVLVFAVSFLKKNIIFQSANLIIALILLPIMAHYINFITPDLDITPQNIWNYQKIAIILGALSGLILASITSQINPSKDS
ncbi:hypothetical protein OAC89_01320 [Deltaproteobacteria bacterium]|nr:hypothetical protein [Deltaproteobacteria bacterium]